MNIDKITMAHGFILESIADGHVMRADTAFDMVDEFESEAVKRGLLMPEKCPKCKVPVTIVDLTTAGSPMYRVTCDCARATGASKAAALNVWWEQVND